MQREWIGDEAIPGSKYTKAWFVVASKGQLPLYPLVAVMHWAL